MDFNKIKEILGIRKAQIESDIAISREAKQIIEAPLVKQFFTDMEKNSLDMWKKSAPEDVEGRERLYLVMRLTDSYKMFFEKCIVDGQMASQELENLLSGKYDNL